MNIVKMNALIGVVTIVMASLLLMNEDTGLGAEWNGLPMVMLAGIILVVAVFAVLYLQASHKRAGQNAKFVKGKEKTKKA